MPPLVIFHRSETATKGIFCNVSRHHELEQIVRAACFGTHAGHLESSKGMPSGKCTGAPTIDVKVSNSKFPPSTSNVFGASRK
jgi:hypothetical protein